MATYENVTYNSPDGAKIGASATEKLGFYGVTPVVQPSGAAGGALTLTTCLGSGFGFQTSAGFNAFIAQIEEIRASLVDLGLHAGA